MPPTRPATPLELEVAAGGFHASRISRRPSPSRAARCERARAMATVDASSLRLRELNGIKVYEVSSARAAPEWAKLEKSKRKLRKREDYQRRIELVQDLSFTA